MTLELKNIGMIKEANVKIDGLTVIAGENDTGKTTLGKTLYFRLRLMPEIKKMLEQKVMGYFNKLPKLIFDNQLDDIFSINLEIDGDKFMYEKTSKTNSGIHLGKEEKYNNIKIPIFIESPLVWNLNKFFNQMSIIESQAGMFGDELSIDYPFFLKDLHFRLSVGTEKNSYHIEDKIFAIINGKFKKDDFGNFYFEKDNKKISLLNTATGIKYFGLFQVLSQNNYLNKETVLILDEPEVHLHPEWQLEMAKIIVELVKNGVKVLVTSHSPYMIQALIKYARDKEVTDISNFYLSKKDNNDLVNIENVNEDLNQIFSLLAEPMNEVFEL